MSTLPLTGKVAIVTGASRSIGAALAIRLGKFLISGMSMQNDIGNKLAQGGANVVINYVSNIAAAEEVVAAISQAGNGRAIAIKADIGTSAGRQLLIDDTLKQWGKLDIL